jgi:GNAT superfamily N-acetyltransferase
MQLREATPADAPAVVALVESAYRGPASRTGWTTEADLLEGNRTDLDAVSAALEAPDTLLLLATDGNVLLGCCQLERRGELAYFGTFAVRPAGQGGGTGSALLAEAERRAARWGAAAVEMTVIIQRIDLIAWYGRRGYAPTGERRPFPYGDERFGLPRREDLEFTVLAKPLTKPPVEPPVEPLAG